MSWVGMLIWCSALKPTTRGRWNLAKLEGDGEWGADRPSRLALVLEADSEEEHSSVTLGPWGDQDRAWYPEAVHCGPIDICSAWYRGLSSASRTSLLRFCQPSTESKLFPDTSSLCCYLSTNVFQLVLMEILNKVWNNVKNHFFCFWNWI